MLHQQQMELHQAQMQYASYGMMGVRAFSLLPTPRSLVSSYLIILLPVGLRASPTVSGATATAAR